MGDLSLADRLDRWMFWPAVVLIGIGTLLLAVHTVPNPNVTWDEAGQFWMTQGQAFGTPWGTPPGSLWEGLDLGRHGNILDPVGFTMLLWSWIWLFGSEPSTLRALPFAFFLGTIVVSFVLGRKGMGLPRTIALSIPAAVLTTYISLQWATEIRPYSIELFGVVVAAAGAIWYLHRPSWGAMIGLSSALVFFSIFTRYSFALAAGSAMLVVLLVLWRSDRLKQHWKQVVFGFALLAITAVFLIWNLGFFDTGDQVWDNYGDPIRMRSLTDFENVRILLQVNFVYGWHKLTGLFLIGGAVAWVVMRFANNSGLLGGLISSLGARRDEWLPAWLFVGIYEMLSATASQMGLAQWNSEFRHSIGLISAAVISGLGLLVLARSAIEGFWPALSQRAPQWAAGTMKFLAWTVWVLVLAGLVASTTRIYADFRRTDIETLGVSVPTKVAAALASEQDVRWLVDTQLFPSLRYLVEASGVPLGNLEIDEASGFGLYGHNPEKLLAWMREANVCLPGRTTAVLVANSADFNADVYRQVAQNAQATGCVLQVVPLSDVESMVIVK